ncbi:hypothetical protein TB2_013113 [Malus domestica]
MDRSVRGPPNLGRLDSSVTVESVDLAVSSIGINSTAARTVGYLSKSRSRRISGSLLIEVISLAFSAKFENPRGRDAFLPRSQSQDVEVSRAPNVTSTNLLLGRARPTSWHARIHRMT